jgi:hypothetical protein
MAVNKTRVYYEVTERAANVVKLQILNPDLAAKRGKPIFLSQVDYDEIYDKVIFDVTGYSFSSTDFSPGSILLFLYPTLATSDFIARSVQYTSPTVPTPDPIL